MREQLVDFVFNAMDTAALILGTVLVFEALYQMGAIA